MKNFMKKIFFVACLLAPALLSAQQPLKETLDSAIRVGKLENGLTYYLCHNNLPENRVEFYIAQRVGSILEEEHQRGLAHFLEHMAFNGTTLPRERHYQLSRKQRCEIRCQPQCLYIYR